MSLSAASLLLALFTCAMWFAWFGWDDVPYDVWQVVGCSLSVCVGAVVALVRSGRGAVLLTVTEKVLQRRQS